MTNFSMKRELIFHSKSTKDTFKISSEFMSLASKKYGSRIPPICLFGTLGSGKTTFVKGIAKTLGWDHKKVKSPTFTFVRVYKSKSKRLYHCDFYRIEHLDELIKEMFLELLKEKNALIVIEWSERVISLLPKKRIDIHFAHRRENHRDIQITY